MDQIVSRGTMFNRGAAAFYAKKGINDHGMNLGAPAIKDWQAGWVDAKQRWNRVNKQQAMMISPGVAQA